MSEHRQFLIEALGRVIDGSDISNAELVTGIPDARLLKGNELDAYYSLSYWTDDADIRDKDPQYGPARRMGLVELLQRLNP